MSLTMKMMTMRTTKMAIKMAMKMAMKKKPALTIKNQINFFAWN